VTTPAPSSGGRATGTVFDIGYQRYAGVREGKGRSRRAIIKDGIRAALGLGRGGRAKLLPWAFIVMLAGLGLIMAMIAGAAERLAGPEAAAEMPSHSDFYGIASIILFVFGAIVGPELLCRDRREGTINLYLVRPITGSDYIVSRWLAFLAIMLATAWLPQLLLFIGLSMGDPDPVRYLTTHWLDVPRFLAAGLAMAVYTTTLAMLTASFTTRRAFASIFLVGLFIITTPFTAGLSQEIGGKAGQWISMFNLTNIPVHVNDIIFGDMSEITEEAPARLLPASTRVLWFLLWTVLPGAVLWWRYRKLSP
jgi:ABC-2 type transport system permease protein